MRSRRSNERRGPSHRQGAIRRAGLLGAAGAILALAPASASAAPLAGGAYGGGFIGPRFIQPHFDLGSTNLKVSHSGRSLDLSTFWAARCRTFRGALTPDVAVKNVRVGRGGRFTASVPVRIQLETELQTGAARVSGTVEGGVASGTGRVRFDIRDAADQPIRDVCDTGAVRWEARVPAAVRSTGADAPRPRAAYYGTSSQRSGITGGRLPFRLRVNRSARQVAQAAIDFNYARCQSSEPSGSSFVSPAASIRRDGSFAFTELSSRDDGATRTDFVSAFRGGFENGKATGTWRITNETRRKDDGVVTDRCDTGTIRWRAVR